MDWRKLQAYRLKKEPNRYVQTILADRRHKLSVLVSLLWVLFLVVTCRIFNGRRNGGNKFSTDYQKVINVQPGGTPTRLQKPHPIKQEQKAGIEENPLQDRYG